MSIQVSRISFLATSSRMNITTRSFKINPPSQFYLSLNSCEKIFCQRSIHFCCCAVSAFPGVLKDLVSMSLRRARIVLIASIVFQSDTANLALLPSNIRTPAYIWSAISTRPTHYIKGKLTSQRTSPQRRAIANSSTAVVSWAL